MSIVDDFLKLEKKRLAREKEKQGPKYIYLRDDPSRANELAAARALSSFRKQRDEDIAPFVSAVTKGATVAGDIFDAPGVWNDGYHFGDVTKAILGTAGDAGLSMVKGAGRLGEGVGDLAMYGAAGVGDLFGADDWADRVRKDAADSLVDKLTQGAANYLDYYSILGSTSQAVGEGVGQALGIAATGGLGSAAGLGTTGVTALTTGAMFGSSMGSGMGEAYQSGATDGEALAYGLISGAADTVTELLFGGMGKGVKALGLSSGLSSADDMLAKALSSKINNQIGKNLVQFGIKSSAEGLEEVLAGLGQAVGKKLTYMSEEDIGKIIEDENLLEQFIVGSLTSAIMQTGDLVKANKNKSDFVTNYTQDEQAVIEAETNKHMDAPMADDIAPPAEKANTLSPDDIAPPVAGADPEDRSIEALIQRKEVLETQMQKANEAGNTAEEDRLHRQWQEVAQELYYADRIEELEMQIAEARENGDTETQYRMEGELNEAKMEFEKLKKQKPVRLTKRKTREIAGQVRKTLGLANNEMATARDIIERYRTGEISGKEQLVQELQERLGRYTEKNTDEYLADVIKTLRSSPVAVSENIKRSIADYGQWYKRNFGKLKFSKDGMPVDEFYYDLNSQYPGMFPESIINPEDQLLRIAEVANMVSTEEIQIERDAVQFDDAAGDIIREVEAARQTELTSPYADKITVLENELSDKNDFISKKSKELYDEIRNIKKGQKASEDLGYLLDHVGGDIGWRTIRAACLNAANQPEGIVDKNNPMEPVVRELLEDKYKEAGYELERLQKEEDNLLSNPTYQRAVQRRKKQDQMDAKATELIGDTTYWKDKTLGIGYKTNTLRRNLRDIVRGPDGKRNVAAADRIWDWLQGTYNTNEAKLKQEFNRITAPVAELGLNKQEAVYTQMLGEFRHNPDSTVTPQIIEEFLAEHKDKIDEAKVDEAITQIRQIYDDILPRVNETLREFGMKEIPYRQGYFPHFVEEKQGKLAKLLNWKTQKTDIPTSIAGMTEEFKPKKSWQSFDKQRMGDITEYNALQGLDTYLHGALDWIYHIEDIQRRRTVENYIRYIHSDEGVKAKIDELKASNEYDAEELQEQIDLILKEAANPLSNFVTDLRTGTNTLAGKKSSMDRGMEAMFNRQVYSTMTNVSNRVSANQVVASISSAMTNFIPITQSWGEVSPISSLIAMGDTLRADVKGGDGIIEKSTFLTNRLATEQKLYKTTWDKIGEKAGWLMEAVDSFTSQTVWRSKYMENLKAGMSENEAIRNADQFAENVIAGRSRGNMPTIFDSKNPLIKIMTAFQLEVANQYGYLFKDMPQDVQKNRVGRLAAGYTKIFIGAYVYNALYSSLTGRTAALDPIRMIQEFLSDIFDDEDDEELVDNLLDFGDEVLEEVPFIGGLVGGGRIPISSAFPYGEGPWQIVTNTAADISEGNWERLTKEWMNPLYYIAMPMGGGQLKKTVQGLSMFSDDLPMPGSYTDSGNLRFPVDDTLGNVLQAGIFGQWASENARDYFDNKRAPLNEKQIQQLIDSGWTIQEYWDYQDEMKHIAASIDEGTATDDEILTYKYMRSEDADFSNYGKVEHDEFNGVRYANIGDTYYDWYEPGEDAEDQTPYWRKLDDEQTTKYIVTREAGEGAYYATNGEVSYCWYKPDGDVDDQTPHWKKITDEQLEKQEEVTESLGITPEEYWTKKEEYTFAYEYPRKYQFARAVGGYDAYRRYSGELSGIQSDKDSYGKSISGSRKKKVIAYVNGLDADYGTKVILFKSEYPSDDTYNYEIVDYLNGREDISYEEMEAILKYLGFDVDENGNITWD